MAKSKKKFDVGQFVSSFKRKQFAPLYFFYGEETLLIEEVVDALIEHAIDPAMREFNLDVLHGNETDGKKIVSLASAYPMMSDRRVVIVKEFERVNGKEAFEAYAERPSITTSLVLIANNADFRKKPFNTFKKLGIDHEASPLRDFETTAWIESRIQKLQRSIEPQAVQLLYSYVGSSLRELVNEIEKLLLTIPENSTVTVKDVERIVGVSREFSPFELATKVGEKNIAKSIEIADRLIGSGESAVGIIAILTIHFVKLWKLHDGMKQRLPEAELARIASTHPFFLKSYLMQAKQYQSREIENAFLLLSEADLSVKSSGDARLILTKTIVEIISGVSIHSGEVQ